MPPSKSSADGGFSARWSRKGPGACLLLPLALLFAALAALRRLAYRLGWLSSCSLPVPVVVVGNITAGGAGKTPVVIHLARALKAAGRSPGILSRGYGAENAPTGTAIDVADDSDPAQVGDEPLLIRRRTGCPVVVGRDRVAAGRHLLAAHPECDVLLCDDGLQHYRLRRAVEIAVLDRRGVMNGWPLPAGPLREPASRLGTVDALVLNGAAPVPGAVRSFAMRLAGARFYRADAPDVTCTVADLRGRRLHAVAGIGDPVRFFDHLAALGLSCEAHPFPDHHAYAPADLNFFGDALLTTEKDAVKLARLLPLPHGLPVWVLPVEAEIDAGLVRLVLEKIDGCPPA